LVSYDVYGRGSDTLPALVWRQREELEETPVSIVGVRGEIRTSHLKTSHQNLEPTCAV